MGVIITFISFISFKSFWMKNMVVTNDTSITSSMDVTRDMTVTSIFVDL